MSLQLVLPGGLVNVPAGLSQAAADARYLRLTGGTLTGQLIQSQNGAASAPPLLGSGAWFTGGTTTTTKPYLLIEPAGTSSANWNSLGTGLAVNADLAFTGNLFDFQRGGVMGLRLNSAFRLSGAEVSTVGASGFQGYTSQASANADTGGVNRSNALGDAGSGLLLAANYLVKWSASGAGAGDVFSGIDTGLARNAVGVVEVNNGNAGTFAVLRSGALIGNSVIKTAVAYTALTTDFTIFCDPTSNAIAITLPASPLPNQTYTIKDYTGKAATHAITIVGTIDGASNYVMSTNYQSATVIYNGTNWNLV